jgi:hypothetical protein
VHAAFLVLLLVAGLPTGDATRTLVYRETAGGKSETHTYSIAPLGEGYLIRLVRPGVDGEILDRCETDATLATLRWEHRHPGKQTEIRAEREGPLIRLSGTYEGRPIRKTLTIDAAPWRQLFSVDFEGFGELSRKVSFWSIGTAGVGAMKAAEFSANPQDEREIQVDGRSVRARRMRVSLTGLRALLWHGDYWFRKSDGRYVKYVGGRGLFAGSMTKELVAEE